MTGRPVLILAALAATLASTTVASAGSPCGCNPVVYAQPQISYQRHIVYRPSVVYRPQVVYQPQEVYSVAPAPVYVVNQGPTYTEPVPNVEPSPFYAKPRPYPYYDGGYTRWHRRQYWQDRPYAAPRFGYRPYRPFVGPRYAMPRPHMQPRHMMPYPRKPVHVYKNHPRPHMVPAPRPRMVLPPK